MDIRESGVAKTVGDVRRTANRGDSHVAVRVRHSRVAGGTRKLDAPKRIVHSRGPHVAHRNATVAVVDVCARMDAGSFRDAETVSHIQRRVRRHAYVVVHGIGSIPAEMKPSAVLFRIDGLDAHTLS